MLLVQSLVDRLGDIPEAVNVENLKTHRYPPSIPAVPHLRELEAAAGSNRLPVVTRRSTAGRR